MTHTATGDWMFLAIGVLYVVTCLTYTLGHVSLRNTDAAAAVTSMWLAVWTVLYAPWWSTLAAGAAVVFFAWKWYQADAT